MAIEVKTEAGVVGSAEIVMRPVPAGETGIHTFLGVPYAASPTGDDRSPAAAAPTGSVGRLRPGDATAPPHRSRPRVSRSFPSRTLAGDNCLNVNVFTPDIDQRPPACHAASGSTVAASGLNRCNASPW